MTLPASSEELDAAEGVLSTWLEAQVAENSVVEAAEREPGEVRRWYVRVRGETKDHFAVWFTIAQRTLRVEIYVMPAPEENEAAFYRHLLVRNDKMHGLSFCIGGEDAIFLSGRLGIEHLTETDLDRLLGSAYAAIEQTFWPALRLGFASRLAANEVPGIDNQNDTSDATD